MRYKSRFPAVCVLLTSVLTACASGSLSDYELRDARELPERFVLHDSAGETQAQSAGACRSPLLDPRNGVTIQIVRSIPGQADYEVPPGAYGVGASELLRIDCGTGEAIGIVRR